MALGEDNPSLQNETQFPTGKLRRWVLVSRWRKALLFSTAYFLCAEAGNFLSPRGGMFVSFWLPAGLYLGVLLLNPTRDWPWLALAVLPANLAFDLFYGTHVPVIIAFYCANTVQAVAGAWLMRRFVAEKPTMAALKEFFGLVLFAGTLASMLGAAIGAATLVHSGLSSSFEQSWKVWWGSNAMAILLLTPLILTWFAEPDRPQRVFVSWKKSVEAALLFLGLGAYLWYLLAMDKGIMSPNKSLAIPFLLWAGLRFGQRGAMAARFFTAATLAFFTTQFSAGLTPAQASSGEYVFALQTLLTMAVLVSLIPATVLREREQTLMKLQESEERLKNLSAAAFEGICISENGRMLDVNNQFLAMFHCERADVIGHQIIELVAPESRVLVTEAIRAGRETIYGHQLLRKDGSIFFAEAQAQMLRVGDRTLRMTALRDVSERKRAEEALRKSEALFRSYFELAMVGCAISSLKKDMITVNDQFCQMLGFSREELQKMTWTQLTHPDDVSADVAQFNRVLAGEIDSYTLDKRYLRKDGQEIFVTLSVRCVRHADGTPDYFVGLVMDITERKLAEAALKQSAERFSMMFKNNPLPVALIRLADGTFLDVNESFLGMAGFTREEVIGHNALELKFYPDPSRRAFIMDQLHQHGHLHGHEQLFREKSGKILNHVLWFDVISISGEECTLVTALDITERKRVELEREEAVAREQQARAEYTFELIASQEAERKRIATELHDSLGQNLLLIKNRVQLALTDKVPLDGLREQLEDIGSLASMSIAEVRQISRDLHPHQLDHLGLTRALEAMIDSAAEASDIEFKHKFEAVDDLFSKDAAMNLYRVAQESLNNILKHSRARHAHVRLERDVLHVQLTIEDDGRGFKAEKTGSSDRGMGLKNIAERVRILGGTLTIESQPKRGTQIEVKIPTPEGK
jgi:PAS domain S-box-containing protein